MTGNLFIILFKLSFPFSDQHFLTIDLKVCNTFYVYREKTKQNKTKQNKNKNKNTKHVAKQKQKQVQVRCDKQRYN